MITSVGQSRWVFAMAASVALCCGLITATPGQAAQQRDFLVGPVTLGPGDTLMVAVANANLGASCRATARVRFLGHDMGGSVSGVRPDAGVVVDDIVKTDLGAAVLAPGQSAKIQVRGGDRAQSRTVQVSIETDRPVHNTAPCINLGGTVVQGNGQVRAVSHAQFADDFSILRPSSRAVCVGSASCDELLDLCEKSSGCSFTCHVAIPSEGQACVFGSTD
jgi:hypothetical protein